MFIFSAALRSVSTGLAGRLRPSTPTDSRTGGPFLHWVPDRPEGTRLAGDYLPPPDTAEPPERVTTSRRPRRRR